MSNGVRAFFANPWVGAVGTAASVLSVGLAIYFYVQSRTYADLRYMVSPTRASVVHRGDAGRLDVRYDGEAIPGDICAVQVAIWNQGRIGIRREHILEPIRLSVGDSANILEASIGKSTRSLVGLRVLRDSMTRGTVSVDWRILERNDGGVLQLIYSGSILAPVRMAGVVEGQGGIREVESRYGESLALGVRTANPPRAWLLGAFAMLLGLLTPVMFRTMLPKMIGAPRVRRVPALIMGALYIVMGLYIVLHTTMISGPPFQF